MLMQLAAPRPALLNTTDPTIEAMVNLMPDFTVGQRLHALYVNKVMGIVPGNFSQLIGTGPSFRSIFFPSWQADPFTNFVASDTGLDDNWWRDFSVALLCSTFAAVGSRIPKYLKRGDIDSSVNSRNGTLRSRSYRLYSRLLGNTYGPFVDLLRKVNPQTARPAFRQSVLDNALSRQLWYSAGLWTSPDWEVFNQYAKYMALGASDADVDQLADDLVRAGLPMPSVTNRANWRNYAEQFRLKPTLDSEDFRGAASNAILKTIYVPNYRGGMPSAWSEGNCFEFTANSQPGNGFRESPSSCCFTGDTEVLDANLKPIPLSHLKPGDRIATGDSFGTVAFIARPQRAGRAMFCLGGGGPVFTDTHPFVNGAKASIDDPAFLALAPDRLGEMIPTLASHGIGPLTAGATLTGRAPGQAPRTVAAPAATPVASLPSDPYLYDISLVCDTGDRQDYWAGRGDTFYLVSPEFPIVEYAAEWAPAVVSIMEGLHEHKLPQIPGTPEQTLTALSTVYADFGTSVFLGALGAALGGGIVGRPPGSLFDRINHLYIAMAAEDLVNNAAFCITFDTLLSAAGQWLAAAVALGWRDFTQHGGDVLVLTVLDMSLSPQTPIPAESLVKLEVTIGSQATAVPAAMWDRLGRANTRFHHYFDQLIHYDLGGAPADEITFRASIDGAPIPSLYAQVPLITGPEPQAFRQAPLMNATAEQIGVISFDYRRMSRDAAEKELAGHALWTPDKAAAFANALGAAMVDPILKAIAMALSPKKAA